MADRYTKSVLTVIAVCLVCIVVRDWPIAGKAEAVAITRVYIEDINPAIRVKLPVKVEGAFRPASEPRN